MTDLSPEELKTLAEKYERRMSSAYLSGVRDHIPEETLMMLIAAGNIEAIVAHYSSVTLDLSGIYTDAFKSGASAVVDYSGKQGLNMTFDYVNERVQDILTESRLRLTRNLSASQREVVAAALRESTLAGRNPREVAREIRSTIGLSPRQLEASRRYRSLLERGSTEALRRELRDKRFDRTVARATRGAIIPQATVDKMVAAYQRKALKYRSELIARTESKAALQQGLAEAVRQSNGALGKKWVSAFLPTTRDHHADMHGQVVGAEGMFVSGRGNLLSYPGDPAAPASERANCVCVATVTVLEGPQ